MTLHEISDAILIHSKPEEWENIRNTVKLLDKPFVLAGGLTLEHIEEAIKTFNPFCIDLGWGVELQIGKKDFDKVEKLIEKVRKCYNGS